MRKGFQLSEEHKKKIGEAHRGKTMPEETKQKISIARKGFHHTEETKRKMREAHIGKPRLRKPAEVIDNSTGHDGTE